MHVPSVLSITMSYGNTLVAYASSVLLSVLFLSSESSAVRFNVLAYVSLTCVDVVVVPACSTIRK